MRAPISVRLDNKVRGQLQTMADARGIGLATLLREVATHAAREAWRAEVRAQSAQVAQVVAGNVEAASFYADWGTPDANV